MTRRGRQALAALLAIAAAMPAAAQTADAPPSQADAAPALREEELLLLEIIFGGRQIAEALSSYATPSGVYLPIGELTRILDVDVRVDGDAGRAEGVIGAARRKLEIDLKAGRAAFGDRSITLGPREAIASNGDIYLRLDVLQAMLPITLDIDTSSLSATLTTREQLPFEEAELRRRRRKSLGMGENDSDEDVLRIATPYRLFAAPSIDVNGEAALASTGTRHTTRWDVRAAGDLLWSNYQFFAGSDLEGEINNIRLTFERRDPNGRMLGPFGATRMSAGDIYTPSLAMGPRSAFGRGFTATSEPLELVNIFERIDLRGELPLGYEVELYVNDVLRGSQATPIEGRYEFPDIPLVRGLNTIRLVFYGPRGERREDVREINVGAGVLAAGQTVASFGVAQQERPLISTAANGSPIGSATFGDLRAVASVAHGITPTATVTAGVARFTPDIGETRTLVTAGLRTSILGYAVQADAARDSEGGRGAALALAGRPLGLPVVARHGEYRDGFIDEVLPRASEDLRRTTDIRADFNIGLLQGYRLPVSARVERDEYMDGSTLLIAGARMSAAIGDFFLSAGADYSRQNLIGVSPEERLIASFDATSIVGGVWQVRASSNFEVLPRVRAATATFTVDRDISEDLAVRFGVAHSFGGGATSLQLAGTRRFRFGDLALNGDYQPKSGDFRVSLQFAAGIIFDPFHHRYVPTRPGAASGGSVALHAFVDANLNGVHDEGEEAVPGVVAHGGERSATTGDDGTLLSTGIGGGAFARIQVDLEGLDNPYLTAPPQQLEFVPGPGRVARIDYPMLPSGEVAARLLLAGDGKARGLAAVNVEAVRPDGTVIAFGRTEYDGSIMLERLPAGPYQLRIEPGQAQRLSLSLTEPVTFVIPPEGGYVGDVTATVRIDRPAPQQSTP